MKIIIVDIETSGLDPKINGILSIGAIELKTNREYYGECRLYVFQEVNPLALIVNGFTEKECREPVKLTQFERTSHFYEWIKSFNEEIILAGQSPHFDYGFLKSVKEPAPFKYRLLDLHSIMLHVTGLSMSLEEACDFLKVDREPKIHNALEGARAVARCFKRILSPNLI